MAMAIFTIICSIFCLARALIDDMACEFACAVGCAETISANVLKLRLARATCRFMLLVYVVRAPAVKLVK